MRLWWLGVPAASWRYKNTPVNLTWRNCVQKLICILPFILILRVFTRAFGWPPDDGPDNATSLFSSWIQLVYFHVQLFTTTPTPAQYSTTTIILSPCLASRTFSSSRLTNYFPYVTNAINKQKSRAKSKTPLNRKLCHVNSRWILLEICSRLLVQNWIVQGVFGIFQSS